MMFLNEPEADAGARQLFADDEKYMGWIMNVSRLWAYSSGTTQDLFGLIGSVSEGLSMRERGILITACASSINDSYCSLSWGAKLASQSDGEMAASVVTGEDEGLSAKERALARWARAIAKDANATTQSDVDELRLHGFSDKEIFGITVFVGLRIAFSKVNGALGVSPDAELREFAPAQILDAVEFGRPIAI